MTFVVQRFLDHVQNLTDALWRATLAFMIRSTLFLLLLASCFPLLGQKKDAATTQGQAAIATEVQAFVQLPRNRPTGLSPSDLDTTSGLEIGAAPIPFDTANMMRSDEVRPGMKGYGLSVFSGIKPEKFDAEVVGVRHRMFAKQDIILCRLSSPHLVDIGVVAGMSGSPVYMNEKLIGAVAYGWQFTNEPLAGVTPIEAMLEVYNTTPVVEPPEVDNAAKTFEAYNRYMEMRRTLTFARPDSKTMQQALTFTAGDIDPAYRSSFKVPDSFTMEPLATPILVSSASPATLNIIQSMFARYNVQPIVASMNATSANTPSPVYVPSATASSSPGGPVEDLDALAKELSGGYGLAVPFVEGDLNMAGVGTVSYRNGDRLVAFGHPMFEQGIVDFPMAPARINSIVRSVMRPFKLGEPLGQIGVIRQDRQPAIGAVFGQKARMFDVTASVQDPAYRNKRDFVFRVWNDRDMGPSLLMSVLMEALTAGGRSSGDTAALLEYTLAFDDGTSFSKEEYAVDQFGGMSSVMSAGADVGVLMNNPYRKVRAGTVDFRVKLADRLPQSQLLVMRTDKASYKPGEVVSVDWELQPYRKPIERMQYSFRLPDNIIDGEYRLTVSDSSSRMAIDRRRSPGAEKVYDYESLLKLVRRNYPRNKVYVTLEDRDTGVAVRGQELPKLPATVINTIKETADEDYFEQVTGNFLVDADLVTAYDISGVLRAEITVERRPK